MAFDWDSPIEVAERVKELLEARAYDSGDGMGASLALDATSPRASLLGSVQEVGLVQSFGAAVGASTEWALTRQGVASLRPCVELAEPLPVCRIRECVPLQEQTTFELVLQLRRDGWVWKTPPSSCPGPCQSLVCLR